MDTTTDIRCKANIDLQGNIIKDVQTQLTRAVLENGLVSPKTFKRADTAEKITLSTNMADDVGRMLYCVTDSCVYIFKEVSTASFDWIPLNLASLTTDNIELIESGSGNAVTDLSLECSNGKATLTETKGSTFLTSHQSVVNNDVTLNYKSAQAIATIGGQEITAKSEAEVTNKGVTLAWDTEKTIAEIDGQKITAKLPLNPKAVVSNKNATLSWGAQSTLATIDETNITAKMPDNPNTINIHKNVFIVNNSSVGDLINTYTSTIYSEVISGATHFDLINALTDNRFTSIGLGVANLLSLMGVLYKGIVQYCGSVGIAPNREIVFHFQFTLSGNINQNNLYHIPLCLGTYDSSTDTYTFTNLGQSQTIGESDLYVYYRLGKINTSPSLSGADIQLKFNFTEGHLIGTQTSGVLCSMTPQITLI